MRNSTGISGESNLSKPVTDSITNLSRWMQQKRYSNSTISIYLSFVRQFFVITRLQPDEINKEIIEKYNCQHFIRGSKSYATQNQWINAIKLYLKVSRLEFPGLDEIERPRKQKKLPNVLSTDEVQAIFHNTPNLKHRALLMLVYAAGLRIGEALNLRLPDIRSNESLIYIWGGKGKKDRRVPLSAKLLEILRTYYKHTDRAFIFLKALKEVVILAAALQRYSTGSQTSRYI